MFFVYQYYQIKNSIKLKPNLAGISASGFDFESFIVNNSVIKTRIQLLVSFQSLISFTISELSIQVYKNGLLLARSTPGNLENKIRLKLEPGRINTIYQNFDIHTNIETINLIAAYKQKKPYNFNYKISFKILGITLTKTGTHENK